MRNSVLPTLLLSTFLAASCAPSFAEAKAASADSAPSIALVGGTILDVSSSGRSSGDVQDGVVLLRGGTIVAAGPRKSVKIPAGARRIDVLLRVEECYRRAGARYLAGSGTTAFGTLPGVSLHTELELLSRVGLPPRQVLAAATSNFGETFHWKTVGQVKAGYNADLLVLNANPLQGIENLKNIHTVILNGEILDRDKLLAEPH